MTRPACDGCHLVRVLFLVLSLAGCSFDGSTDGPAGAQMVTGVATTGAPMAGTVLLKDSSPVAVQLATTIASDGSFAFNTAGLQPPFILKAAAGTSQLYSIASGNGIVNLTPLTSLALALAAGSGDLERLYVRHQQPEVSAAAARMPHAIKTLQKQLALLMGRYGVTQNILSGQFQANRAGMEALLDAIEIALVADKASITNKSNGALILSAPLADLAAGRLLASNLPQPTAAAAPASGVAIYTAKCAGCHGAIAAANMRRLANSAAIMRAIDFNLGGMRILDGMSAAEIAAVSSALTSAAPVPAGNSKAVAVASALPPDGAALYASLCAGCHGALATSRKAGMTIVRLQNAISGSVGGMAVLARLSWSDMQAITTALNTPRIAVPAWTAANRTPDGEALYVLNCGKCHGALASSGKRGITLAQLQNAVTYNIGGMGYLSQLTVLQVQALVTVLTPDTPTPTPTFVALAGSSVTLAADGMPGGRSRNLGDE